MSRTAKASSPKPGGTLGLIARRGEPAPGAGPGVNFHSLDRRIALNDAGQTAFTANLIPEGEFSIIGNGVYSEAGGTLSLVARTGDPAPGTALGVNFRSFGPPSLNNAGQTAFVADLTGTGVNFRNDTGIFTQSGGTMALLAREGNAAPGTEPGVNFNRLLNSEPPLLNKTGETAFVASLTGPGVHDTNDVGLFSESRGTLGLVAREGDPAPGTGAGVKFRSFGFGALNDAGQTAFYGFLTGSEVDATNELGLFVTNPGGTPKLIVREGDVFDVNPSPLISMDRTISVISNVVTFSNNTFNNQGQIVFRLAFTDGTEGVFVATITVPEPVSLALWGVSCLGLLVRRQQQTHFIGHGR